MSRNNKILKKCAHYYEYSLSKVKYSHIFDEYNLSHTVKIFVWFHRIRVYRVKHEGANALVARHPPATRQHVWRFLMKAAIFLRSLINHATYVGYNVIYESGNRGSNLNREGKLLYFALISILFSTLLEICALYFLILS